MFLDEEWTEELPYIDSEFFSSARTFFIFLSFLLNFEKPYWLYLMFEAGKRDGAIEHIHSMVNAAQVLFENLPCLFLFSFLAIHNDPIA